VNIVYRKEIEEAANAEQARADFSAEYRAKFANPYKAAELGFVDEVIHPRMLRKRLAVSLEMLKTKRLENPPRKHGNIPL
jgi:propionyl-CoA carboxylase beta chain